MKITGTIESIFVSGYERLLSIVTSGKKVWCSGLQCNEYLEAGEKSKYLVLNERVSFTGILKLVVKYEDICSTSKLGILQEKTLSPHAIVVGKVLEKKDAYEYVLAIGNEEIITAEFEIATYLNFDETIKVEGELAIELT